MWRTELTQATSLTQVHHLVLYRPARCLGRHVSRMPCVPRLRSLHETSYVKCAIAGQRVTYFIHVAAMAAQLLAGGGNANLISAIQVRHKSVGRYVGRFMVSSINSHLMWLD